MKSYCVKQRKETQCTKPDDCKRAKNGRLVFFALGLSVE